MKKSLIKPVSCLSGRFCPSIGVMVRNFYLLAFEFDQWASNNDRIAINANAQPLTLYTYTSIEYLQKNFTSQSSIVGQEKKIYDNY